MFRSREHGYVLLALLLVVFITGSSFLFGVVNSSQPIANAQQRELARQLQQAKESLLAYVSNSTALLTDDAGVGPGYFPCPDLNNNGLPGGGPAGAETCNATANIGRIPQFVTLPNGTRYNFNSYYAGLDEQFWLVVHRDFLRTAANTDILTRSNPGPARLSLNGQAGYVALLVAPGEALPSQDRTGSGRFDRRNYFDGNNALSTTQFTTSGRELDVFNDQILGITHTEVVEYMGIQLAKEIRQRLETYHASELDYPNTFTNTFFSTDFHYVESVYLDEIFRDDWLTREGVDTANPSALYADHHYLQSVIFQRLSNNAFDIAFENCPNLKFRATLAGGISTVHVNPANRGC